MCLEVSLLTILLILLIFSTLHWFSRDHMSLALQLSLALLLTLSNLPQSSMVFNLFINDNHSSWCKQLIIVFYLVLLALDGLIIQASVNSLLLVGFSLLATLFLLSSNDWFFLFLSLELLGLSSYCLVSMGYTSKSIEAGIKYFVAGAIGTILLLFGLLLIYFTTGTTSFLGISMGNAYHTHVAAIFILATFLLKLGAAPFHYWIADVYEGSPALTTIFLSVVVKVSMVLVVMSLITSPFFYMLHVYRPLFIVASTVSILLGCFGALFQKKIKRLLAYSSINNIGYVLAGLSIGNMGGLQASLTYTVFYCWSLFLLFFMLLNCTRERGYAITYITDLKNLRVGGTLVPLLCATLLFSFAGVPPLTGFFIKLFVLSELVLAKLYFLAAVAAFSSVLSSFYYISLIKILYFEDDTSDLSVVNPLNLEHALVYFLLSKVLLIYALIPLRVDSCFYNVVLNLVAPLV